jgi:phenylalanine-4-hydroxylase
VEQDYSKYTARDQAAWRYIMRQNRAFFADRAVSCYTEGLVKTGIPIDHIPRIEEMDRALSRFGWGAVAVCGFIPPAAFIDLQAQKILPIAVDMRTPEHIAYTPAPDIVHEAAGHAPIVSHGEYADYLTRYARLARKAIFSKEDIRLYEAIRLLSDIKENPDMTAADAARAQANLDRAVASIRYVSEASKVARMYWWTAEYGLMGNLENPQIYGAGLLSSVGESASCLRAEVRKIPLSLACVDTPYDITEPQPQLFVARDFQHLNEVLQQLERQLSFTLGGTQGLDEAVRAETICTVALDSGIEFSGMVTEYEKHNGEVSFVRLAGASQLCRDGKEIPGHGRSRHGEGFSVPLGRWKGEDKAPWLLGKFELESKGLKLGAAIVLHYESGMVMTGKLEHWEFLPSGKLSLMTLSKASLNLGDKVYFRPEWGDFDLVFGSTITSVYGGAGDVGAFGDQDIGRASSNPGRQSPFSAGELKLFHGYESLRRARETFEHSTLGQHEPREILEVMSVFIPEYPHEWLLRLELVEWLQKFSTKSGLSEVDRRDWERKLREQLGLIAKEQGGAVAKLIQDGLALVAV